MTPEQERRLQLMRELRTKRPTEADYIALIETCFEQDLSIHDTVREVRSIEGCSLLEALRWLQLAVTKSTHPVCVERRQSVLRIGRH